MGTAGLIVPPIQPAAERSGSQSAALTSGMTNLRRYRRKLMGVRDGFLQINGTVTCSTGSTALTGTNTRFLRDLFFGAKVMQLNGTTLIGYVASVASDTSAQLTANAAVNQTALLTTIVPHLNVMEMGDSVAILYHAVFGNELRQAYFNGSGYASAGGGTSVGYPCTIIAQSGTVANTTTDYNYNPTGQHTAAANSATVTYGAGGVPILGNTFAIPYLKGPNFGTFTIDLQDNANAVQSTSGVIDCQAASISLGWYRFNFGASPVSRKIRITVNSAGNAGAGPGIILPFTPIVRDTTRAGLAGMAINKGGLGLDQMASVVNPGLIGEYIAEFRPDLTTYHMVESYGTLITTSLPQVYNILTALWTHSDWLFEGHAFTSGDAGYEAANNLASCPTWIENEQVRGFALSKGHTFFDGATPTGSYEKLVALDQTDGTHVGTMIQQQVGGLMDEVLCLTRLPGLPIAITSLFSDKISVGWRGLNVFKNPQGSVPGAQYGDWAFSVTTDASFGYDANLSAGRYMNFQKHNGTGKVMTLSLAGGYGGGCMFGSTWNSFETTAAEYPEMFWTRRVEYSGAVITRYKIGGTLVTMTEPTYADTKANMDTFAGTVTLRRNSQGFCTNALKSGESTGAGTGVPVYWETNGTPRWLRMDGSAITT